MAWNCVICYEPLSSSRTICAVICGHVFHEECIDKWLISSRSCPQCRKKCLTKDIVKLFFNEANTDDRHSAVELLSSLDDLKLRCSENNKRITEQDAKIKKLKDRLKKIKDENESLNTVNTILREKDEMYKSELSKVNFLLSENQTLQTKLSTLTKLEKVLNGTAEDVEKLLCSETNLHQMAIFQVTLKRALLEAEQKKHATHRMYEAQKGQLDRAHKSIAEMQNNISILEEDIQTKEDALRILENNFIEYKSQNGRSNRSPVRLFDQTKEKKKSASTDDEDIFDKAFITDESSNRSSNFAGSLQSKPKLSLSAPINRASSPYHHLSHGSISESLKVASSKMKNSDKRTTMSVAQTSVSIPKPRSHGVRLSLNSSSNKRPHLQSRTTYQTTKLPRKDNQFNFSLSPPYSTSYKTTVYDSLYGNSVTKKSPTKNSQLKNRIVKRTSDNPESSGIQSIRNFLL